MKSAKSLKNNFFDVLKSIFRQNLAIAIIAELVGIALPLFSASIYMHRQDTASDGLIDITESFTTTTLISLIVFFVVIFIGFSKSLFKQCFSKRASDFYFALPIKRGTYYNAGFVFGMAVMALSFISAFLCSLLVIKTKIIYNPELYIFDIAVFAKTVVIAFFATAVFLVAFMMSAVLSGRDFHYIILCFVTTIWYYSAVLNFVGNLNQIWGMWLKIEKSWFASPISILVDIFNFRGNNVLLACLVAIIQIAIFYFVGYFVFKNRKAEVAETTLAGKIVPAVIITLIIISTALSAFMSGFSAITFLIAVVECVIETVIISAIFYRKPFNKLTLISFCVAIVVSLIIALAIHFVPKYTYQKYVPNTDEIESVKVINNVGYYNDYAESLFDSFLFSYTNWYGDDQEYSFELKSDEAKEKVLALHKVLASSQAKDKYYNYYDSNDGAYEAVDSIQLIYTLKNGRTVTRTYQVMSSTIFNEYVAVIRDDETMSQLFPFNFTNDDILYLSNSIFKFDEFSQYYAYVDDNYFQLDDYSDFLNALKTTYQNVSDKDFIYRLYTGFEYYDTNDDELNYDYDDDEYDYVEDYNVYVDSIGIYYIDPSATDEQREKIKAMSMEEIIAYRDNMYNFEGDYDYDTIAKLTDPLGIGDVLQSNWCDFSLENEEFINYLESIGLTFEYLVKEE